LFLRRGRVISSRRVDEIVEVDLICGGEGLVLLPNGRDGRQLVLLLTLSVEPSLNVREELAAGRYCGDDTRVR